MYVFSGFSGKIGNTERHDAQISKKSWNNNGRLAMLSEQKKFSPVLFFETYSILQILFLSIRIRKAQKIIFLDNNIYISWEHALGGSRQIDSFLRKLGIRSTAELRRNFAHRLIRLINHGVEIRVLGFEDFAELSYSLNKDCLKVVDGLTERIKKFSAYEIMHRVIRDDNIIRYYKSFMAPIVPRWFLFTRLSRDLIHDVRDITIVPDNLRSEFRTCEEYKDILSYVPSYIFHLNCLRFLWRFVKIQAALSIMPIALLAKYVKNGYQTDTKGEYDLAMPVLWGIYKNGDNKVRFGVRKFDDDSYIYGDGLVPGRIIHIFGDWKFPPKLEVQYKEAMDEKGIPHVEKDKYKLTKNSIVEILRIEWLILSSLIRIFPFDRMHLALLHGNRKGLYNYIRKHLELENVNYKVEYVKTDYNPANVINTILCNQKKRKTVAIAHAASSYDAPQIAFAHFDKYLALCEIYVKTFGPYWENVNLIRTGRESLDWMWERLGDKSETINKINQLYGKRRHVVTITLPGDGPTLLKSSFEEMYKGLCSLKDVDLDCHIFLRVRRLRLLEEAPVLLPFKRLPEIDSRIILDHDNFDTLQLISVSDFVIAGVASWVINEAALAGKRVFTFGYTKKERMYFPDYGKDFILDKAEDIVRVFQGFKKGFAGFDCDWEKLKKDADYYQDGNNCHRIRQSIMETINNTDGSHSEKQS
ncbi:MAG: hypothetical protein ACOYU4_02795 [Thermodesulfobacteriota bacterium]